MVHHRSNENLLDSVVHRGLDLRDRQALPFRSRTAEEGDSLVILQGAVYLFRIAIEEQVNHHFPGCLTVDFPAKSEDFTCQEPPHQTDRFVRLDRERCLPCENKLSFTLLLHGIAMSMCRSDVDGSQKAITGILTNEASVTAWWSRLGLVRMIRRGSLKAAWIWLVNEPGVKRPARQDRWDSISLHHSLSYR